MKNNQYSPGISITTFSLVVFFLLSFSISKITKESKVEFGVIDDTYSVNNMGAYNHIIPIDLPSGINGLQPKLAISYDSRAGLSELGLGWSLSGISSIKRAGNNIAQHGKDQGITFGPDDAFLLDGQYLTLVRGENGKINSHYRTENQSFKKIYTIGSLDGSNASPLTFIVKSPDGLTYTYGELSRPSIQNTGSRNSLTIIDFKSDNKREIIEWKIKEIRDNYGNFILFNYESNKLLTSDAQPTTRVQSIYYAGNINNGSVCANSIIFRYSEEGATGRKSNENFISGVKFKNENVLKKIVVRTKGEDFRTYNFVYDETHSKLENVFESADEENTIRLRPTEIEYNTPNRLNFKTTRKVNIPYLGIIGAVNQREIDLDLDGKPENLVFKNNKGNTHLTLKVFKYDSSLSEPYAYSNERPVDSVKIDSLELKYDAADFKKIKFGDFDNDGYTDFVSKNKIYINFYDRNDKIEFQPLDIDFEKPEDNIFSCSQCELHIYDIDNDNKDEILQLDKTNKKIRIYSLKEEGDSFTISEIIGLKDNFDRLLSLELNQGNSLPTLLYSNSREFQYIQRSEDDIVIQNSSFPALPEGFDLNSSKFKFQDFNFDGLVDVYLTKGNSISISINRGSLSGFPQFMDFQKFKLENDLNTPNLDYHWGNFTNSGLLELFIASGENTFQVYSIDFNNDKINIEPIKNASELIHFDESIELKNSKTSLSFGDINGDGVLDLSTYKISNNLEDGPRGHRTDYINETNFVNRLKSVKDGFGNIVNVNYTTTKDEWVYRNSKVELINTNYRYFISPYVIVGKIEYSNGLHESTNIVNYRYEDLIYETTGRGLSGFKRFIEVDNASNIEDEKVYEYEFPLTGKIIRHNRKLIGGPLFFQQTNSWATKKFKKSIDFIPANDYLVNPENEEFKISGWEIGKNNRVTKNYVRDIASNRFSNQWFKKIKFTKVYDEVLSGDIVLQALPEFNKLGITYLPYLKETQVKKWEINDNDQPNSDSKISYEYNDYGGIVRKETTIGHKITIDSTDYQALYSNDYGDPYVLGLPKRQKTYAINKATKKISKPRIFDFEFNNLGKIELKIREKDNDSLRHFTKSTYDKFGNILSVEKYRDTINKIKESFEYTNDGRFRIKSINPLQDTTQYEYDKYGHLKYIIDPNKNVLEKKYDRFGKLYKEILPNKNTTEYKFEFLGASNFEKELIPKSAIYKLTTSTKSRSDIYSYYDSKGREVASLYRLIDTLDYPINNSNPRPVLQRYTKRFVFSRKLYNKRGNLSEEHDPRYVQITNRLRGSPCIYQEGDTIKTLYKYDGLNRLIKVNTPDGTEFSTTYKAKSKKEKNEKSDFYTTTVYNSTGEIEKVLDSHNNPLVYSYDLWGNVIKIEGEGQVIITEYDHIGRKKYVEDSSINKVEYFYDEFDRLISENNKSKTTTITYDKLSRITEKKSNDRLVRWYYDGKHWGKTDSIEVFDSNGKIQSSELFDYDSFGNINKIRHKIDHTTYYTSFDYDQYYRISAKSQGVENIPNSIFKLKYTYINDIVTSIHQISDTGQDLKKVYEINSLDALGNVRVKSFGNDVKTKIEIGDRTGLISSIKTTRPDISLNSILPLKIEPCLEEFIKPPLNTSPPNLDPNSPNGPLGPFGPRNNTNFRNQLANSAVQFSNEGKQLKYKIQDIEYFYDSNYSLFKKLNHLSDTTDIYGYDALNRLKSHTVLVGANKISKTEYEIRHNGNIHRIDDKNFGHYDNEAPHRIKNVRLKHEQKLYGFDYDDFGNVKTIFKNGNESIDIKYSSFNKPIKIKNGRIEQTFVYGSANQQITSTVTDSINGNTSTLTPFTDFEVVKEGNNIVYRQYIVLNGELIAINNKEKNKNSTFYIHKDNLGSIDVITDDSGTVVNRYGYAPYGERKSKKGNSEILSLNKGFTGHKHLNDFGLINMGGRFYMPEIGRFLSADPYIQDPSNLQSLNRYSYVFNNPLNLVDPSGFWGIRIKIRVKVKWNPLKDIEKAIRNTGRAIAKAHEDIYNEADRFVNKYGKQIVMIAAAAAITYFSAGTLSGFGATLLSGAYWGAGIGAAITAINGGDFNDILNAAYNGAITGATAAAAASSIGLGFEKIGMTGSGGHILSHGVSGGLQSEMNGGNFEEGFWSASISKAFVPSNESLFGTDPDDAFKRITYSATIGGLSAHINGGNVMQGALTAGFIQRFNKEEEYKRYRFRSKYLEPGYQTWKNSPKVPAYQRRGNNLYRPWDNGDDFIDAAMTGYEILRELPASPPSSFSLDKPNNYRWLEDSILGY